MSYNFKNIQNNKNHTPTPKTKKNNTTKQHAPKDGRPTHFINKEDAQQMTIKLNREVAAEIKKVTSLDSNIYSGSHLIEIAVRQYLSMPKGKYKIK